MNHFNIFTLLLFIYSPFGFADFDISREGVFFDGKNIYYLGDITESKNERVISLLNSQKFEFMVIKSKGGDIFAGMDLGDLVLDYNLKVKVREYCNSSCANYVIASAREIIVENGAFVIFHGGALQVKHEYMSRYLPELISWMDELAIDCDVNNYIENAIDYYDSREAFLVFIQASIKRECLFFKKRRVSYLPTIYGQITNEKDFKFPDDGLWQFCSRQLIKYGFSILKPESTNPISVESLMYNGRKVKVYCEDN